MALKVSKAQVWAGEIPDQPGGLAGMLEQLAEAGADLECVIARRQPDKPGTGLVFVTPLKGRKQQTQAKSAGMNMAEHVPTLRVEGPNKQGMGARLIRAVAEAGVNMRGVSGITFGRNFVAFLGFDTPEDANQAARAIKKIK